MPVLAAAIIGQSACRLQVAIAASAALTGV
jgi:hypothetical protein